MTRQHTWPAAHVAGISEAGKHVARHLRGRRNRVSERRVHVISRSAALLSFQKRQEDGL
jgi:hypothetical protein